MYAVFTMYEDGSLGKLYILHSLEAATGVAIRLVRAFDTETPVSLITMHLKNTGNYGGFTTVYIAKAE